MSEISYTIELELDSKEFQAVLIASGLAERRPIDNPDRLAAMCNNANLIVCARCEGMLIGIARSLSDFAYCTYLSDLAVDKNYQHLGIGKELIRRTKSVAPLANLILLSAPGAKSYYPRIGLTKHEGAFILREVNDLKK